MHLEALDHDIESRVSVGSQLGNAERTLSNDLAQLEITRLETQRSKLREGRVLLVLLFLTIGTLLCTLVTSQLPSQRSDGLLRHLTLSIRLLFVHILQLRRVAVTSRTCSNTPTSVPLVLPVLELGHEPIDAIVNRLVLTRLKHHAGLRIKGISSSWATEWRGSDTGAGGTIPWYLLLLGMP